MSGGALAWLPAPRSPAPLQTVPIDSIAVTLSATGTASRADDRYRLFLQDGYDPAPSRRIRAATLDLRGDTVELTLPAEIRLARTLFQWTMTVPAGAPSIRFTFDLIRAGSDTVGRCVGEGRLFELGRLPDGGIVHRVDGRHPFACGFVAR
jgi:hypothetical protein